MADSPAQNAVQQPRGMSVNVRRRVSRIVAPIPEGVTVFALTFKIEYVNGQPVTTYYLPDGSKIEHEKQQRRTQEHA